MLGLRPIREMGCGTIRRFAVIFAAVILAACQALPPDPAFDESGVSEQALDLDFDASGLSEQESEDLLECYLTAKERAPLPIRQEWHSRREWVALVELAMFERDAFFKLCLRSRGYR